MFYALSTKDSNIVFSVVNAKIRPIIFDNWETIFIKWTK